MGKRHLCKRPVWGLAVAITHPSGFYQSTTTFIISEELRYVSPHPPEKVPITFMERKSANIFSNCPWEGTGTENLKAFDTSIEAQVAAHGAELNKKGSGASVMAFEESRGGQPKSYIPNFFYKPPFGYPRYEDLIYFRQLAASVYVDMVETAIIDEICAVEWDIVAEDRAGNEVLGKEKDVERIRDFFYNPNTNKESWEYIIRMMLPDLLELNSGILVKTFNAFGEMVEIVARDGAAFTKNPDPYGMYTNRADLILMRSIYDDQVPAPNQNLMYPTSTFPLLGGELTTDEAKENGAYFQYGFNSASRPVPFGKREIVWLEKKVRTDNLYGRSAMAVLAKTVQTLIYSVEHNLEYFTDNSIPPGVLGLEGLSVDDMKAFGQQWNQSQRVKDDLGNWKKKFHKLAIVNRVPKFEKLGYTNQELELIESNKWWSKLVWGAFGMTATELGFTEDAKGSANQIVQSSIAKKRIIYPLLRLIEYHVNTEIIPEFGVEGVRYKYKIFDVDEEKKKWELYELQTKSDMMTINEVRNKEGLDPVEWGDKNAGERSPQMGTNINLSDPMQRDTDKINNDAQNTRNQMTGKDPKKKAVTTDTPLTLESNEELDENLLEKEIVEVLAGYKEKVYDVLEMNTKPDPLTQIKGIDDIPKIIKDIFNVFTLKKVVDAVIGDEYNDGWEKSEKQINQNVQVNKGALEFLQNHTFDNIKSMTEEVANDLRAELSRGIINGEGITKLKERVDKVFKMGDNRAAMIARTETSRADNQGKLLAMKESGVDMKKYLIITYDDRTSSVSKAMGSKYGSGTKAIPLSENFSVNVSGKEYSGSAPPFMPNDRDVVVFVAG